MATSKRWANLFSLIFILKCLTKFNLIRKLIIIGILSQMVSRSFKRNYVLNLVIFLPLNPEDCSLNLCLRGSCL